MNVSLQPYKGTRDFYPEDKTLQTWMFSKLRQVVQGFGYLEYDGPMLESFELYAAKTGAEIVNQQLYSFLDRGERKVAIRPEMTPTLARMVAAKLAELPKPIRWFSIPNLWRYERPQKGRLREHWQLNVDVLGGDRLLADAEILTLALDLFSGFGAADSISIRVNNRALMDHLFLKVLGLDEAKSGELAKALDSRAKISPESYLAWLEKIGLSPGAQKSLDEFLASDFTQVCAKFGCEGSEDLARLFATFSPEAARRVVFDASIMRGMDYYTGTVFEAYDVSPENKRALFGGGRYDNLVGMFSGKQSLSGIGFGLGDVTLKDFLQTHNLIPKPAPLVDLFFVAPNAEALKVAQKLAQGLRAEGYRVITPLSIEGFGAQLKTASKHGAAYAALLGESELAAGQVALKNLSTGAQQLVAHRDLAGAIKAGV